MLTRRALLRGTMAGMAAAIAPVLPLPAAGRRAAAAMQAFTQPLRFPPVLTDPEITLVAAEADIPLLPGAPTRMWTFNGMFPGPTIRRPSGQTTLLTVQHRLPADVDTLTIHHHGAHAASAEDGQPGQHVISPGGQRTYRYDLVEGGEPERGALQWYHDHSHRRTNRNTWHGLLGMFILDDPTEADLPLPAGDYDLPLLLGERSFDDANQLTRPYTLYGEELSPGAGFGYAPFDEVFGTELLVNGVVQPYLEVEARRYRLRLLNTAPHRPYNLQLRVGDELVPFFQIATESGLLPERIERTEVLLGPAERAEIVVDFAPLLGADVVLGSYLPSSTSAPLPVYDSPATAADFLELRVRRLPEEPDLSSVPQQLRPLPPWTRDLSSGDAAVHRVWAFGAAVDPQGRPAWTVNGRPYDHNRVDAMPALGSVETWALVNAGTASHYVHLHDSDWKVVSRNGEAPLVGEDALKETFRIDPGEVVVVGGTFADHLGRYLVHCHMVEHEDHGMMASFEVVPPASSDRAAPGLAAAVLRDVAGDAAQQQVLAIVAAARRGRPAARALLGAVGAPGAASPAVCRLR